MLSCVEIGGEAEAETRTARNVLLYGLTLPVIGRRELIANKTAAGRPKDLLDLALLARTARTVRARRPK